MQVVAGVPGLEKIATSMIDIMIQGEISLEVHVEALLRQCTGTKNKKKRCVFKLIIPLLIQLNFKKMSREPSMALEFTNIMELAEKEAGSNRLQPW